LIRAATVLALVLLPIVAYGQQPRPAFSIQPGGVVAASLPVAMLGDPDIRTQLGSGLTTTFLIVARNRNTAAVTGARLELRYDLWDEVWLVRKIEFDGRSERQRIASRELLEKWWRTPLRLLVSTAEAVTLQIDVDVLPFSAAEKEDARQWISKSGGVGTGGGSAGIVDALIGTTIDAKPITTFHWNVELALR
jgi:hypothetical protein